MHTKGSTKDWQPHERDWRQTMQHFAITRWRDCIHHLRCGHSTVGANLELRAIKQPCETVKDTAWPHYSGNFWWASCLHIAGLAIRPRPDMDTRSSRFRPCTWTEGRFKAEWWLLHSMLIKQPSPDRGEGPSANTARSCWGSPQTIARHHSRWSTFYCRGVPPQISDSCRLM